MSAQNISTLKKLKLSFAVIIASFTTLLPVVQLSAQENISKPISITGRVLDINQKPDTANYKYSAQNPKKVAPGQWFQLQFKIKNTGEGELKNIDLNWSPSRLIFPSGGAGNGNGATVTPSKYSLAWNKFPKGGERMYTVSAKFKDTVENGQGIDSTPTISATNSNNKRHSDKVVTLNVEVQRAVTPETPEPAPCTPPQVPNAEATACIDPAPVPSPLEVTKSVDNPNPKLNEPFTYTITVKNIGTEAKDVRVYDFSLDPDGTNSDFLTFIKEGVTGPGAAVTDVDFFGPRQAFGGSFTLAAGESQTLSFKAQITKDIGTTIKNFAYADIGEGSAPVQSAVVESSPCVTEACLNPDPIVNPGDGGIVGDIEEGLKGAPESIPSTGPGAVAAGIVGISALGYGARQWMASRKAMHDAMDDLYKKDK